MRGLLTLAALGLVGCAENPPIHPAVPSRVSIPAWAEGDHGPSTSAPPPIAASSAPVTIGTDAPASKPRRKKIDLDLVDADVPNVCRLIGELAGVNVVVGDGVRGKVTLRLHGVPWDEALDAVLLAKGYRAEHVGSVIVVRAK